MRFFFFFFLLRFAFFFFACLCRYPDSRVSYDSVRSSLNRFRIRHLPKNASNVAEINAAFGRDDVMAKFGITSRKKPFFRTAYACALFEYCIFASDDIVKRILADIPKDRRNYLMDATFKICPHGVFKQLLIIHICYLEKVFFCLFVPFEYTI